MPIFEYDMPYFEDADFDREKLCVVNKKLQQRKVDENGEFSFSGTYEEYVDIELPVIKLYDLSELFGFRVDMTVPAIAYNNSDYGDVKLQLSFDGGDTYFYWNIVSRS